MKPELEKTANISVTSDPSSDAKEFPEPLSISSNVGASKCSHCGTCAKCGGKCGGNCSGACKGCRSYEQSNMSHRNKTESATKTAH